MKKLGDASLSRIHLLVSQEFFVRHQQLFQAPFKFEGTIQKRVLLDHIIY